MKFTTQKDDSHDWLHPGEVRLARAVILLACRDWAKGGARRRSATRFFRSPAFRFWAEIAGLDVADPIPYLLENGHVLRERSRRLARDHSARREATIAKVRRVMELHRRGWTVTDACAEVGIDGATYRRHRRALGKEGLL